MGFLSRVFESPRVLRLALNLYPPYLGAGVKVTRLDRDLRGIRVELPLRWFNRNYVGTQFGGSLYSMTDPFLMLMLLRNLGADYVVWDKAARIEFLRPGRGRVHAEFALSADQVDAIREEADRARRALPEFEVTVRDEDGEVVARVHKTLYVRRKLAASAAAPVGR